MSDVPDLRPASHLREIVLFVLAIAGGVYAGADKLMAIGKGTASLDKIERIEAVQNQQSIDLAVTKMEARAANAGMQRLENKVDTLNETLSKLNITRRNR